MQCSISFQNYNNTVLRSLDDHKLQNTFKAGQFGPYPTIVQNVWYDHSGKGIIRVKTGT